MKEGETDRQTDRDRQRQTETETQRHRHRETEADRQTRQRSRCSPYLCPQQCIKMCVAGFVALFSDLPE